MDFSDIRNERPELVKYLNQAIDKNSMDVVDPEEDKNLPKLDNVSSIKNELNATFLSLIGINSWKDKNNNVKKEIVIIKFRDFFWKKEPSIRSIIATKDKIISG